MTVKELLARALSANDFDGLTSSDCACFNDDLVPCNQDPCDCQPGHKVRCPDKDDCKRGKEHHYHIKAGPK